jgi:hypothetical protein
MAKSITIGNKHDTSSTQYPSTTQSQLTRVKQNQAAMELIIIAQNTKLDKQAAELKAQKDENVLFRQEQTDSNLKCNNGISVTRTFDEQNGGY